MINPNLYQKLKSKFKDVIIENQDVIPDFELLQVPEYGKLWRFRNKKRGETYRINCPICGDSGNYHCYISAVSFTKPVVNNVVIDDIGLDVHCFRRNCFRNKEARETLLKMLDGIISTDINLEVAQSLDFDDTISSNPGNSLDLDCLKKWQPDYHIFDNNTPKQVLDYVKARGISDNDIERLKIGWGKCWNAKKDSFINNDNWLLFPIFDQMGLRGFQSRQLINTKMKYFFDFRTPKKMCLYNREEASKYRIVAICEGIIDAIHIGKAGMAFFGSEPSLAQMRLIQQDGADMVLYLADQKKSKDLDPIAVADKIIADWQQRYTFPWGVHRIDVPGEDAGVCSYDEIWLAAYKQLQNKVPDAVLDALEEQIIKLQ